MFGTPVAALTTSSQFIVSNTDALAVAVGGVLATVSQKGNNCL